MAEEGAARDIDGAILEAAMQAAAFDGWRGLSLRGIAEAAGVSLAELRARIDGPLAVLRLLNDRLDVKMLEFDPDELEGLTPRERLFEVLMRRLDAMGPYKAGIERLAADLPRAPELWGRLACNLDRSMTWLMAAADIRYEGGKDRLARQLLAAAYGSTLRVWLKDESEDKARTLAELDKRLAQLDRLARFRLPGFPGRTAGDAGPAAAPA